MSAFRNSSAIALFCLTLGSTSLAFAQAKLEEIKSSHDLSKLALPTGNSEAALFQRLQNQRLANAVRRSGLLRDGDSDQLREHPDTLMELLKKSGINIDMIKQNPAILEKAMDEVKKGHGFPENAQVRPDEVNNALKDLNRQEPATAEPAATQPPLLPLPNAPTSSGPSQTSGGGENNGDPVPSPRISKPAAAQDQAEPETPRMQLGDKVQGWAERFRALNPELSDSPALQRAVQSLAQSVGSEDPKWRKLADAGAGLRERVSDWGKSARLERFWPSGHFEMPDVPEFIMPSTSDRGAVDLNLPSVGSPDASAGGIVTLLAWLVAIVAGAICLRKLWFNVQESKRETRRKQALMNAWPVDPLGVNSREELIRAYEFLALSRLGMTVKSWNHLAIAASLGNSPDPLRRNAALSLTDAYEHARYAPLEEALPHEVIAEARRHLCLLAGVHGA
ncbi:MAG TPA: hypothetical protein VGP68_07230 [Gemmataceae bacterium]|jgi:hypothetical protein|nr:hypothetical protein [Gemmataceae bacterium]